jgi:hypothetical protein
MRAQGRGGGGHTHFAKRAQHEKGFGGRKNCAPCAQLPTPLGRPTHAAKEGDRLETSTPTLQGNRNIPLKACLAGLSAQEPDNHGGEHQCLLAMLDTCHTTRMPTDHPTAATSVLLLQLSVIAAAGHYQQQDPRQKYTLPHCCYRPPASTLKRSQPTLCL